MTLYQPPYPPQLLVTYDGYEIVEDDSNRLGIFNPSGTEIAYFDSSGGLTAAGKITANSGMQSNNTSSGGGMTLIGNYPVAPSASQSNIEFFGVQGQVNGTAIFNIDARYSTNSTGAIDNAHIRFWSVDLNAAILHGDFYTGQLHSYKNTLDNGSGDMIIAGQFRSAHQLETSIQGGTVFNAVDWIGFAQLSAADGTSFYNATNRTIFALVFWNSTTVKLTTTGTVYINFEENTLSGKIYMLVMASGASITNGSFVGYAVFWWGM